MRAAALLQLLRHGRERRILVHAEERALDLEHNLPAGLCRGLLLAHDAIGVVVVVEVVVGEHPKRPEELRREPRKKVRGDRPLDDIVDHVTSIEVHGADPAQMVEADVVETDPLRVDVQCFGDGVQYPDRRVAQADRLDVRVR